MTVTGHGQGRAELSGEEASQWCPSRLCLYAHEMVILTPNQATVRIKWPEICERFVDSKAFCNSKRTLGHPWSHFHSGGRGRVGMGRGTWSSWRPGKQDMIIS